jgi:hypothetical protein
VWGTQRRGTEPGLAGVGGAGKDLCNVKEVSKENLEKTKFSHYSWVRHVRSMETGADFSQGS